MKKFTTYDVKLVKQECKLYDLPTNKANSSSAASEIIQTVLDLNSSTVEKFGILCLDAQLKVIGIHIVSIGTLTEAVVDIRGIFQRAILNNARSLILFHNHPGGSSKPSPEDVALTKRVKDAGKLLDIIVNDHIICYEDDCGAGYTSLAEQGLM